MGNYTKRVIANLDDIEENVSDGVIDDTSSDLELHDVGGNDGYVGMRWTVVSVPQSATIDDAKIQFHVDEVKADVALTVTFRGHDHDNAPAFSTTNSDISDRTETDASVDWVVPHWVAEHDEGSAQLSVDIKSIVQEIVDRGGWSLNNAMVIMIKAWSGSGERTAESFDGENGSAPQLIINYTESTDPSITDVETNEEWDDKDTALTITGSNFEASQGTGKVEVSDNATYASGAKIIQTITSWGATAIDFTADLGSQSPGTKYVWVTNNTGDRNAGGFVVTVHRAEAFSMSASANISASGENTTVQLTAPATKSTSDFDAGRIQDDENPADTVDITLDDYTEMEWCLKALTNSREVQYSFRVTKSGVVISTYTVTPKLTITSGVSDLSINVNDASNVADVVSNNMELNISVSECIDAEDLMV